MNFHYLTQTSIVKSITNANPPYHLINHSIIVISNSHFAIINYFHLISLIIL
jgi:hypothetical protein